jgi:hypothetical protein
VPDISTTIPPIVNGKYQISNADELKGFAAIVNGMSLYQNAAAKAVLVDDIDLEGTTNWSSIGTNASPYTGTFDGQGHKITNFGTHNGEDNSYTLQFSGGKQGLFGYTRNATIKNFNISGAFTYGGGNGYGAIGWASGSTLSDIHSSLDIASAATTSHIGGVCGNLSEGSSATRCSFSGKITDTHNSHDCIGGIGGYSNEGVSYVNCANYGNITFDNEGAFAGGICGYVNNDSFKGIRNCLNVGTVKLTSGTPTYGGAFVGWLRAHANSQFENNYWLEGSAPDAYGESDEAATAVTADQLASGEVCYKLNGDQTEFNWFQIIGQDVYPCLDESHGVVIYEDGIYTAIESIQNSKFKIQNDEVIFNLAGQRLSKMQKGINIINGKKYIKL